LRWPARLPARFARRFLRQRFADRRKEGVKAHEAHRFRVTLGVGLAILLMILSNMAFAAQKARPPQCVKHLIPITRNFNLAGATGQLTRGGGSSASASGFYTLQNPVASASIGYGSIATASTLGEWGFSTVGGDPARRLMTILPLSPATRAGLFDQGANSEIAIGQTGLW